MSQPCSGVSCARARARPHDSPVLAARLPLHNLCKIALSPAQSEREGRWWPVRWAPVRAVGFRPAVGRWLAPPPEGPGADSESPLGSLLVAKASLGVGLVSRVRGLLNAIARHRVGYR